MPLDLDKLTGQSAEQSAVGDLSTFWADKTSRTTPIPAPEIDSTELLFDAALATGELTPLGEGAIAVQGTATVSGNATISGDNTVTGNSNAAISFPLEFPDIFFEEDSGAKWGSSGQVGTSGGTVRWAVQKNQNRAFSSQEIGWLQDSFDQWEDATRINFTRVTSNADIVLDWDNTATNAIAEFSYSYNTSTLIISDAEISFSLNFETQLGNQEFFQAVALQEIGNVMGFGDIHRSDDLRSVMEDPAQDVPQDTLSNVDIGMAQWLYGTPTGYEETNWDVDGNGTVSAFTDGMVVFRYLGGLNNSILESTAAPDATRTGAQMRSYLSTEQARYMLDVDQNGSRGAFTDGMMIFRVLGGLTGNSIISGALGSGARLDTGDLVKGHVDSFYPIDDIVA